MNFQKILVSIFVLAIGKDVINASSAGASALTRQVGTVANAAKFSPIISKSGVNLGQSSTGASKIITPVDVAAKRHFIGQSTAEENTTKGFDFSSENFPNENFNYFKKFNTKRPKYSGQSYSKNDSTAAAQAFRSAQFFRIVKDKSISSTAFLTAIIGLAAMFGFTYPMLVDFLNERYENNTFLMRAVEADNPNVVRYSLDLGVDIHKQNSDGDTAMIIAARLGNENIVKILIDKTKKKYANDPEKAQKEVAKLLNTKNNEGRTALLDVVEYGNFLGGEEFADPTEKRRINILKLCLDNGAHLSVQDNDGNNILFLLANKMNAVANDKDSGRLRELFDIFAQESPAIMQAVNKRGDTLLLQSVADNNLYLFNYLKDKVVDVMHPDILGQNIIIKAANSKNINLLKDVLNLVNDTWKIDSKGATVLDEKGTPDQNDVWTFSGVVTSVKESLSKIGKKSENEKMKELLSIKDKQGYTALDRAVVNNSSLPFVQLLVDKGAQPTEAQLSFAIGKQNIDVVKLFLNKSKLSPTGKDLTMAFQFKNIALLDTLLKSPNLSSELKNRFVKEALVASLQQQNTQMFDSLLPMADRALKQDILKDIVVTGNPAIINDFLNSSQITDDMRREMLKDAVIGNQSEQTIHTLLSNPSSQKAYEDPTLRSLVLREALRKVKIGDVKGVMSNASHITKEDLKQDPVLRSLIVAFEPKYQAGWGTWASDRWASWKGNATSMDEFEHKKKLFNKDIERIVFDENQNRNSIVVSQGTTGISRKDWAQKIDDAINAVEKLDIINH